MALNDPDARTEAAAILRTLVESIAVLPGELDGHQLVLTGDIVRMLSLPNGQIPASFENSVKVVAGTRNRLDLQLGKLLSATLPGAPLLSCPHHLPLEERFDN